MALAWHQPLSITTIIGYTLSLSCCVCVVKSSVGHGSRSRPPSSGRVGAQMTWIEEPLAVTPMGVTTGIKDLLLIVSHLPSCPCLWSVAALFQFPKVLSWWHSRSRSRNICFSNIPLHQEGRHGAPLASELASFSQVVQCLTQFNMPMIVYGNAHRHGQHDQRAQRYKSVVEKE